MENLQYPAAYCSSIAGRDSFAGVGMASMLVWYLAPLIPGFDSYLARTLLVLAMVVIWAGVNGSISWVRRRRENDASSRPDRKDRPWMSGTCGRQRPEEVARLRERVRTALRRLRKGGRRGYLYEQRLVRADRTTWLGQDDRTSEMPG